MNKSSTFHAYANVRSWHIDDRAWDRKMEKPWAWNFKFYSLFLSPNESLAICSCDHNLELHVGRFLLIDCREIDWNSRKHWGTSLSPAEQEEALGNKFIAIQIWNVGLLDLHIRWTECKSPQSPDLHIWQTECRFPRSPDMHIWRTE